MRTRIAALAGDSIVYGLGQAATKSIYLVLVPILTRAFAAPEYGLVDLTNLLVTLLYLVAVLGLDGAYAYHYYRAASPEEQAALTTTAVVARIGFPAAAAVLVAAASPVLATLATGETGHASLLALAALTLPGIGGVAAIQDNLRVTFRPAAYGVFTASNVLANGALTIAFVVWLGSGPAGVFLGRLIADGASVAAGLGLIRKQLGRGAHRQALGRLLRFGVPLVATSLSYWLVAYVDRYVLAHARGLGETGVYSVAAKLAAVVTFFVSAFTLAWGPYCYAMASHPDVRRTMARVLHLYAVGSGLLALALTLFARDALRLATAPAYWGGWVVVGFLAFGNAVYGAYYVAGMAVNMAGQSRHLGWTAAVGAVTAIVLALLLVGPFGMVGVAIATLAGYVAAVGAVAVVGQRVYPLPVRWARLLAYVGVVGAAAIALARAPLAGPSGIAVRAIVLLALGAAAVPLGLVQTSDVREAVRSVRRFATQAAGAA